MKIALVHDYLKEYGGAERVLRTLADMYPDAPIYTAFQVKNSTAGRAFSDRTVKESFLAPLLKIGKLYSPLRFLAPLAWRSMDLSSYDVVIASASGFIARGFKVSKNTKVICYCHTPPRWLYGYETSVGFTKYWPVKIYAAIVGHFMRMYDFNTAQVREKGKDQSAKSYAGVDIFVANSKNVQARIQKFYRRDSLVIYPPIEVERIIAVSKKMKVSKASNDKYFLIVSRLVGAKGLEAAARAFKGLNYQLKIIGEAAGYSDVASRLQRLSSGNIKLLGRVDDETLHKYYAKAKGFIALAREEDFGMTVVEAQAAGTPIIAFNGGGFKESVVDGETGVLINDTDKKTIEAAVKRVIKTKWDTAAIQKNASRFSKEKFIKNIKKAVDSV